MAADALEASYEDLLQSLEVVLARANFVELPHADIDAAHRRRSILRVKVTAPLDDFRDVRFYRRGRHREQFEVRDWFGLRRRKIDVEVYDDVVLLAATKTKTATDRGRPRRGARAVSIVASFRRAPCCSNASATSRAATSTRCFPTPAWC